MNLCLRCLLLPLVLGAAVRAGERGGDVTVERVGFQRVRGPGGDWYETAVEVQVRPAPTNPTRHVDRVTVRLELGLDTRVGEDASLGFYEAAATAVAIEQGRAVFRFYLPPEIVERDRVAGSASYYFVDLAAAGVPLPVRPRQVGPGLPTGAALARFRARVAVEAGLNRGVLRHQERSPFHVALRGPAAPTLLHDP